MFPTNTNRAAKVANSPQSTRRNKLASESETPTSTNASKTRTSSTPKTAAKQHANNTPYTANRLRDRPEKHPREADSIDEDAGEAPFDERAGIQSGAEPSGAVQRAGGTCIAGPSAASSDAKPPDDADRPTPPAPRTSPPRKHSTHASVSIAPDAAVYGPMSWRNSPTPMPEAVNRYRFCGLPTGVNMLPRFAAMVMSVATKHMRPSMPARRKTTKASGTNVMSATSLVTAMLAKNASPTSTPATARCVRARATNHAPTASNTPSERNPATTAIRQNSSASVCQST